MNMLKNIIGVAAVSIIVMMIVLAYSIGNQIAQQTYSITSTLVNDTTMLGQVENARVEIQDTVMNGLKFLLFFTIGLTLFSSFIARQTIQEYVFAFMGSLFMGATVYYLISQLYNQFILSSYLDLSLLPTWFFDNISLLLAANIVAGLASFIFVRRGEG